MLKFKARWESKLDFIDGIRGRYKTDSIEILEEACESGIAMESEADSTIKRMRNYIFDFDRCYLTL